MFTVRRYDNNLKKQLPVLKFPTWDRARQGALGFLGLAGMPGSSVNEWTCDSGGGYARGFSRADDPHETLMVEIHCPEWTKKAREDQKAVNSGRPLRKTPKKTSLDIARAFLKYSFKDISNLDGVPDYNALTTREKALCTPEEFVTLYRWVLTGVAD